MFRDRSKKYAAVSIVWPPLSTQTAVPGVASVAQRRHFRRHMDRETRIAAFTATVLVFSDCHNRGSVRLDSRMGALAADLGVHVPRVWRNIQLHSVV
jgi:hypothetical protein